MQSDTESVEYAFGNFRLYNDHQSLYIGGEKHSVGTKIYYLLILLIEHRGQVIGKETIIQAVWPGQVVTNAALTKLILRLRQLLDDHDPNKPIIETHRGTGYRFTPEVKVRKIGRTASHPPALPGKSDSPAPATGRPTTPRPFLYVLLGLAILALGLYLGNQSPMTASGVSQPGASTQRAISMAIIPSRNNPQWINRGGLEYFSDLLNRHEGIHTISPEPEWYSNESPEKLAISLSTNKNINYSCLIDITESDEGFTLNATLRTESEIIAKTTLSATHLTMLFERADKWISVHLSINEKVADREFDTGPMTQDNYALQSYLQGVYELESTGDARKAVDYFRVAVNKDQRFLLAWIRLAETYLSLSEFEKAISIANTHLSKNHVTPGSLADIRLNFVKAMAHAKLKNDDKALDIIRESALSIESTKDPYVRLAGLESLGLLAALSKDWVNSEKYLLERLALTRKHLPLPNQLGLLHLELARIYHERRLGDKFKVQVNRAISQFEQTGNIDGQVRAYLELNRHNFAHGLYDQGVQVVRRAAPYLDRASPSYELIIYYQLSALILNLRGYFDLAESYGTKMRQTAEKAGNSLYLAVSEFVTAHRYYVQGAFQQAFDHIPSVENQIENSVQTSNAAEKYWSVVSALIGARALPPEEAMLNIKRKISRYPGIEDQYPTELARARGHILIRQGLVDEGITLLKSVENEYRKQGEIGLANYVGFEILEVLLNFPELPYRETLTRLEANTKYDYLLFKLKAQFLAREGNTLEAALIMEENRLRANQLWQPEDQLLLEGFQTASL